MQSQKFTPAEMSLGQYPVDPSRLTPDTEIRAALLWHREDCGEVGAVWEMTPGELADVQGDESFFILSGHATIDFADGRSMDVGPGDAAFLAAGDVCRWTVRETVRKVVVTHRS